MSDQPIETVPQPGRAAAGRARLAGPRLLWRPLIGVALIGLLALLLRERIAALEPERIRAALAAVAPAHWGMAGLFSAMSFWAVGRYDAVVHRLLATSIAPSAAITSGAVAIGVAQTAGLGAVTGTLVRWRLLPGLGLARAAQVSVVVALSFLAAWAILAALALLLVPLPLPGGRIAAMLVLALGAGLVLLSLARPRWLPAGAPLPTIRAMAVILGLALLDTLAAGTAFWILMPPEIDIAAAPVLAAYLLALGAGLVLTTPGGVGPFELALIALLPGVAPEPLLATVLAYRALYYALPFLLAGLVLLRGPLSAGTRRAGPPGLSRPGPAQARPFLFDAAIEAAPRAEAALLRHGRLSVLRDRAGRPTALAAATGQSLVLLGDPLRPGVNHREALALARAQARETWRDPVLYKAGARFAAAARAQGWLLLPVAREAWLDPRVFTADTPARRQLRRKLRKAAAAGLTVTEAVDTPLPLDDMARIAAAWARARGGERGFSMGVWAPETLDWARVYLARDAGGRLAGFITVHANAREHALDLMRVCADAPDGTMHALVAAAIDGARRAGVARFSLAAVPAPAGATDPALLGWMRRRLWAASGATGLQQFKSAFAPRWSPLYIAAPTRRALVLGAFDILREITRPAQPPRS